MKHHQSDQNYYSNLYYNCKYLLLMLMIFFNCSCDRPPPMEQLTKSYTIAIYDALFEKLLYEPHILSTLASLNDQQYPKLEGGANFYNILNLGWHGKFNADSAHFASPIEETYIEKHQIKIYLHEEGTLISNHRDFRPYNLDEKLFFELLTELIVGKSNNNIHLIKYSDDTKLTYLEILKPWATDNSIYQQVQFRNATSIRKFTVTIILDKNTLELRDFDTSIS